MTHPPAPVLFAPFLLATDGSPSAQLAQKLLAPMAQVLQAQSNGSGRSLITVLTVQPRRSSRSPRLLRRKPVAQALEPGNDASPQASATGTLDLTAAVDQEHLQERFTALVRADLPHSLPISLQLRQGRPATEILNCARTIHAGLIAVGSGGGGGMRERLMGSVSAVIARYAPCSVLVARGNSPDGPIEPSLHHVLLVVNSSPGTQLAIAVVRQLIPAGIRQVTILYAQPPLNADYLFGPFVAPTPSWQLDQSLRQAQQEQSEQILHQAKLALSTPYLEVRTLRQTSEAGPLICQVAQQQGVNLIVLGGNLTRRWLSRPVGEVRFPLQSLRRPKQPDAADPKPEGTEPPPPALRNTRLTATEDYTLHHAPCPVLLCRPARHAAP